MKQISLLLFTCLFLGIISCSTPEHQEELLEPVLSEEVMIDLLVDIHIAETVGKEAKRKRKKDTIYQKKDIQQRYQEVFKIHQIHPPDFQQTFDYYIKHPDQLEKVYEEVVNKITEMEGKGKTKPNSKQLDEVGGKSKPDPTKAERDKIKGGR